MNKQIKSSIENLYTSFSKYKVTDFENLGIFDYGPSDDELIGASKPLREVPNSCIKTMEFFGGGWDSWGNESEVKYFLPRLLEYLAYDIKRLENTGFFSLFHYKLDNCLNGKNDLWNLPKIKPEVVSLYGYFEQLLKYHFLNTNEIAALVDVALIVGLPKKSLAELWYLEKRSNLIEQKRVLEQYYHSKYDGGFEEPKNESIQWTVFDTYREFLELISS